MSTSDRKTTTNINYTAELLTEVLTALGPTVAVLPPTQLGSILAEALQTADIPNVRQLTLKTGIRAQLNKTGLLDDLTPTDLTTLARALADYLQRKYYLTLRGSAPFHTARPFTP